MRGIANDALRKLYLACKRRSGFPGNMPATVDSNENEISVHAILQGLIGGWFFTIQQGLRPKY
jgi:hypothetical protein